MKKYLIFFESNDLSYLPIYKGYPSLEALIRYVRTTHEKLGEITKIEDNNGEIIFENKIY